MCVYYRIFIIIISISLTSCSLYSPVCRDHQIIIPAVLLSLAIGLCSGNHVTVVICDISDFFAPHINVITYLLTYLAWREQSETTVQCPGMIAEIGKFSVFFETLVKQFSTTPLTSGRKTDRTRQLVYRVLWATRVSMPDSIQIRSVVFAQHVCVQGKQTDRLTDWLTDWLTDDWTIDRNSDALYAALKWSDAFFQLCDLLVQCSSPCPRSGAAVSKHSVLWTRCQKVNACL